MDKQLQRACMRLLFFMDESIRFCTLMESGIAKLLGQHGSESIGKKRFTGESLFCMPALNGRLSISYEITVVRKIIP